MIEPESPDGFVTKAALFNAFERAGVSISNDQLERWRAWGLLPPVRQFGAGHPGGSKVFYPEITIDQTIEATRLLRIKRSKEFVGFELWWLGFEVDQQYWRPVIEARSGALSRAHRKIMRLIFAAEEDDEIADIIYEDVPKDIAPKPIKSIARNISQRDFTDAFHTLLNAVSGVQSSFENTSAYDENDDRPRTIQKLLGFSRAETDQILGTRIHVASSINSVLKAVSSVRNFPTIDETFFDGEKFQGFSSAKHDVRGALEIARNMHVALFWIYGPRAFGLKAARWYHDKAPPALKVELALLWMCAREEHPEEFYSSNLISDMLADSREVVRLSAQLRAAINSNKQLASICTPKRLKKAFSNKGELAGLCAELRQLTT